MENFLGGWGRGGWPRNGWCWCVFQGQKAMTADMTCILRAPQCTGPGAVLGQREPWAHLHVAATAACSRQPSGWWSGTDRLAKGRTGIFHTVGEVACLALSRLVFFTPLQISALPAACEPRAISRVPWASWVSSQAIAVCSAQSPNWFMASLE